MNQNNTKVVEVFGNIFRPIYRGAFNTGRTRMQTVRLTLVEEKAKAFIEKVSQEAEHNLVIRPLHKAPAAKRVRVRLASN